MNQKSLLDYENRIQKECVDYGSCYGVFLIDEIVNNKLRCKVDEKI